VKIRANIQSRNQFEPEHDQASEIRIKVHDRKQFEPENMTSACENQCSVTFLLPGSGSVKKKDPVLGYSSECHVNNFKMISFIYICFFPLLTNGIYLPLPL
jgi:hypothetical protein